MITSDGSPQSGLITSDGSVAGSGGGGAATATALGDLTSADSPVGLYLGADLTDSSGNGYTLTVNTGSVSHVSMFGKDWFYLNDCVLTNSNAAFQIAGDVTIFFQFIRLREYTSSEFFAYCGNETGGNSIYNHQWAVWSNGTVWAFTHQHSTKTGVTVGPAAPLKNGANGGPHSMCMVRDATANTVKYYLDGVEIESDSYGTDADGGSSTQLYIGGSSAGTFLAKSMLMRNIWIKGEALSAANVLAKHNTAFGG